MLRRYLILACCATAIHTAIRATPVAAQATESRALAATLGTVGGVAAGGYVALSVIVLESRMGRFVFDIEDVLGWRSAPVLIGGASGLALGAYSPHRLEAAVVYGVAGLAAGAVTGLGVGQILWDPPEGRWAGAAIGAGIGLVAGNLYGILNPIHGGDGDGDEPAAIVIPVTLRVSF